MAAETVAVEETWGVTGGAKEGMVEEKAEGRMVENREGSAVPAVKAAKQVGRAAREGAEQTVVTMADVVG
jgi:hypothetical protein